jgi:ketosteroid isomerase-like protein
MTAIFTKFPAWAGLYSHAMANPFFAVAAAALLAATSSFSPADDRAEVARIDTAFQAAVKTRDVATVDATLHPDYHLVVGDGRTVTREQQLAHSRDGHTLYEIQDEIPGTQTVRVAGDTAVVTAKLRIKGTTDGVPFDRTLWFSDTYVRTPKGWKYFFGQASLPLPPG